MSDDEARRAIREDLDDTLWVEAAAGTGKTTELVRRIVALVATGRARMSGIAAVTFTEKAAGELQLRLRSELEAARRLGRDEGERLDAAVRELEASHVGTIHAFCAELLRQRPVEAGLDPLFDVLDDAEEERVFERAFRRWLDGVLEAPPEGIRRILRRPADRDGTGPVAALRAAGRQLAERRDFDGAWTRPPFDRNAAIDGTIEALHRFAVLDGTADHDGDPIARCAAQAARFLDALARRERTEPRDHDALELTLPALLDDKQWDWKRTGRGAYGAGVTREDAVAARTQLRSTLDDLSTACREDLAACLFADLRSLVVAYEDEKRRASRVDYVDLLLLTRRLLAADAGVRRQIQAAFTHLLVDEFQDTDPLQAEVLLLVAADDPAVDDPIVARPVPGKLFVVGDPKQAIYRFRRADVAGYAALRDRLLAAGARKVELSTSFRADPRIQRAVDGAFRPRMRGGLQADYVPLGPSRAEDPRRPAVVALPIDLDPQHASKTSIEAGLPGALADLVAWLVRESGWRVTEADRPEPVPVEARHVCLLFRATRRWTADLVGDCAVALEARGLPHAVVGGRSFHARDEVTALRNALAALEWPRDALAVYATLKGPLFALPDHALFLWKARFHTFDYRYRPEPDATDPARADLLAVREALAVLASARAGRNRRPVAATLHLLLSATKAHAGFAAATGGEQVLANALRVGQLARRFEAAGAGSFRAFVDALDAEARRGESPEAPVVEEATDGVRLMTVHKAKGLEFPVVVLADLTTPHVHRRPSRWLDPARRIWAIPLCGCVPHDLRVHRDEVLADDRAEADRIAYVAATRARDLLVVPVVDGSTDTWLAPLGAAVSTADRLTVRPMARRRPEGLRDTSILAASEDRTALDRYEVWRAARAAALAAGARPTLDAHLATERVPGPRPPPARVEETAAVRTDRPGGPRFGSLVHGALSEVPFDADPDQIATVVALHGRILGAPRDERTAANAAVEAALAHALVRRAAASADCRREVPVAVRRGALLIEGVADLVFRDRGGWVVVDYKTDADVGPHLGRYATQLDAYVSAVAGATGEATVGVLLCV